MAKTREKEQDSNQGQESAPESTTPCICVEVVKAFASLSLEQRLAVHKAIDHAVAVDKERAGLGQESNTELYEAAINSLNL